MSVYPKTVGRYELTRPLAEGGFGQVFIGRIRGPAGFARTVAIKQIKPEFLQNTAMMADFIKEAHIGGYLHHHNVVQVLGFEKLETHHALIMEYVDGVGLDQVLAAARDGVLEIGLREAVEIMIQTVEALQYIHNVRGEDGQSLYLVHRDLKPSNLLLTRNGLVKLSDFGVAHTCLPLGDETQCGMVKGTPGYMSPEQARGEPVDFRSDLYNVAVILYDLLVHDPLFSGKNSHEVLDKLAKNQVESGLSRLPQALSALFLPLFRRLLTSEPATRCGSASEVLAELRRIQSGLKMSAAPWPVQAAQWVSVCEKEAGIGHEMDPAESYPSYELKRVPTFIEDPSLEKPFVTDAYYVPSQSEEPSAIQEPSEPEATPAAHITSAWNRSSLRVASVPPNRSVPSSFALPPMAAGKLESSLRNRPKATGSNPSSMASTGTSLFGAGPRQHASSGSTIQNLTFMAALAITVGAAGVISPVGARVVQDALERVGMTSSPEEVAVMTVTVDPLLPGKGYNGGLGAVEIRGGGDFEVIFDGANLGQGPQYLANVPAGKHAVRLVYNETAGVNRSEAFMLHVQTGYLTLLPCAAFGCYSAQIDRSEHIRPQLAQLIPNS